jgi:hypothetical protein
MSSTFNFNDLEKFQNTEIAEDGYHSYNFNCSEIDNKEKNDFDSYRNYCMNSKIDFDNNPVYDWYRNEHAGKVSEMQDQRFIFLNESKTFGWV